MTTKRNKLPLKLIFGALAMFIVFAFSMALTTTSSAQQAATPTATESPAATSTPAVGTTPSPSTGATSTPATSGSTGSIPVTGSNQAPNAARALAFSKAVTRLSNVSDNNLQDMYNELLARLHNEERMLNSANNKFNQIDRQLGKNAFTFSNNANNTNNAQDQNGLTTSERRNKHIQAIQQDFLAFAKNLAIARQQVLIAQIALNSSVSLNTDGNLANRQAAINALALAQISLDRGMAALRQVTDIAEAR